MNWTRKDKYYSDSDQGYRICAARIAAAGEWIFCAYGPDHREWLGRFEDSGQAKAACEQHWENNNDTAA